MKEMGVEIRKSVARGNIERRALPEKGTRHVPLYQGNGRFGCCYGPFGLHAAPGKKYPYSIDNATVFTSLKYWLRTNKADQIIPFMTIQWGKEPESVLSYSQHQDFFDGTVITSFSTQDFSARITTWFDQTERDIAGIIIDAEGNAPRVLIRFRPEAHVAGDGRETLVARTGENVIEGEYWHGAVSYRTTDVNATVRTGAAMSSLADGVELTLRRGRNEILLAAGDTIGTTASESLDRTVRWWHDTWAQGAMIDIPEEETQKVWIRSAAYVYSTFRPGEEAARVMPCGLSGNAWMQSFPNDIQFSWTFLLASADVEIARRIAEAYSRDIAALRRYTQRLWPGVDGVFIPFYYPFGGIDGYHENGAPNVHCHMLYNNGYICRMVYETALMLNDMQWTTTIAMPLIDEMARFYYSACSRGADGWHMTLTPSHGDEFAAVNKTDYVCALIAAKYTFERAVELRQDRDGKIAQLLREGLAFDSLLTPEGYYNVYADADKNENQYGNHQLTAAAFQKVFERGHGPTKRAFEQRDRITARAIQFQKEHWPGRVDTPSAAGLWKSAWTFGRNILAASHLQDRRGWSEEFEDALLAEFTDPDRVQFYEKTRNYITPFYIAPHGAFAGSVLENIASTYWGELELAPCIPWKGTTTFQNIRTLAGVTVSGVIDDGKGCFALTAWRDTDFRCRGKRYSMKKGQTVEISTARA